MAALMTKVRAGRADDPAVPTSGPFRELVVPIDLTPLSDRVLGRIPLLPVADDARVTLLHVVPGNLPVPDQRRAARDAEKALAAEARHLRQGLHRRTKVEPMVKVGAAAKEIAARATEVEADLIVMGRGSGRALRDAFLGSTAERVVRRGQRPVLVVRLAPRGRYKRPALALDLDDAANEVVRVMLRVLPPPRPSADVIHAFVPPYQGAIYPSLPQEDAEARRAELRAVASRELSELITAALSKAGLPPESWPAWRPVVRPGSPRLVVEKAIAAGENDLLVLGTRARSGAAYVFLGTVAGDLLRVSRCDVLVVPPARAGR